jgi:hypothetical protein
MASQQEKKVQCCPECKIQGNPNPNLNALALIGRLNKKETVPKTKL